MNCHKKPCMAIQQPIGKDLIKRHILPMEKLEPTSEKLSGLSTEGAPVMAGLQQELVEFVKKVLDHPSLEHNNLIIRIVLHHTQIKSLSTTMEYCVVWSTASYSKKILVHRRCNRTMQRQQLCHAYISVKSRGLNNCQFKGTVLEVIPYLSFFFFNCV